MRRTGYSVLLLLLRPFHSLGAVTGLQHVAGLAVAVASYGLLRSRAVPAWGGALAVAPTLFDPRPMWLAPSVPPDLWLGGPPVVAVPLLLRRRPPVARQGPLARVAGRSA